MIGCSFVVDRQYFGDIGLLDPGMEVYGGENIELGMRVSGTVVGLGLEGRSVGSEAVETLTGLEGRCLPRDPRCPESCLSAIAKAPS